MKADAANFNDIVETMYNLPLEYREELRSLLDHNISDSRRQEFSDNYKTAQREQKSKKLKFSSSVKDLKKML